MHASEDLCGIERGGAGSDTVLRKRGLSRIRNRLLRERMWECLEGRVVLECKMRAFVRLYEDNNVAIVIRHGNAACHVLFRYVACFEDNEVRIQESGNVSLPSVHRCQVVAFTCHIETEF